MYKVQKILSDLFDFWRFDEVLVDTLLNLRQVDPADEVVLASQLRHSDNTDNIGHNY